MIPDEPAPGELADDTDDLDWSIERDGRMRDHATVTEDAEPETLAWVELDGQTYPTGSF